MLRIHGAFDTELAEDRQFLSEYLLRQVRRYRDKPVRGRKAVVVAKRTRKLVEAIDCDCWLCADLLRKRGEGEEFSHVYTSQDETLLGVCCGVLLALQEDDERPSGGDWFGHLFVEWSNGLQMPVRAEWPEWYVERVEELCGVRL